MSVDDSQIYLAFRTPSGASALTAFSRATGARLWSDAIGIDAAPAVADGMVFTAEGNHGVSAYSAATGAPLWNKPGLADSAPPVVAGGRLYVGWAPAGSRSPAPLAVFALG
jgi:outer membrane protein assembly factor BamB